MRDLIRRTARWIKKQIDILLWWMLYERLADRYKRDDVRYFLVNWFRVHSALIIGCYWILPAFVIALCYLRSYGCGYSTTRPHMETSGMCSPLESPWRILPSYLDLWDTQASDTSSEPPSQYIRAILVSHLLLEDAQVTLLYYTGEMQRLFPSVIEEEYLTISLNQATEVISSLTNQTAYFAYVLCMEKDFMTTVLRTFVDALLMIIKSDPTRVNPVAFMVWPWGHPLRLLNRQWQSPWFPKPRLYAFEADAEMRFQKQQLTGRFNEALGKISASFPTIQTSKTQLLKGATSVVTIQLKKLQQIIHESDSSRWPWDPKSQETSTLQEVYKLLTDSRNHLLKVLDTIALYEIMLTRLWNDLRPLRTVSCSSCQSKFSPTGSLTVPESLLMQVQNIPFVSLRQSSRVNEDDGISNIVDILPKAPLLAYNLNDIDDNQLSAGRSAIAELCKVGNVVDIPNDNLYTICTIYTLAATMSGLDDDALSRKRRSWMVELKTVTTEFGQQEGFDLGVVRNSLEGLASKAKGIDYYDRRLEHEDL